MAQYSTVSISGLLLLAFTIVGSQVEAQAIQEIAAPSGVTVNYVKCSGKSSKCLNKAGSYCDGSYQVIDSESHAGGIFADLLPGPVAWYSMTFLCGTSDGKFPKFPKFAFRGPQFQMPSIVIPQTVRTTCRRTGNTTRCTTY